MYELVFLGTSNAIPDEKHENTHMVLVGSERVILIDCAGSPMVRLHQARVDPLRVTDLILTHFHPDHVSGVPSFLMDSWLLGRQQPLNIYGLDYTLEHLEKMMELFGWNSWFGLYPVYFHAVSEQEMSCSFSDAELSVFASPVKHLIPTIGLRIELHQDHKVLAYSSDTEPCPQVVRLAAGASVLVHEATGAAAGHSTAAQAGAIARDAKVSSLYLIHYHAGDEYQTEQMVSEARARFSGPVIVAEDFMRVEF